MQLHQIGKFLADFFKKERLNKINKKVDKINKRSRT
jgi:hypothetical protein